ncbi:hypothetical protein QFZ66_000525 [Streptomyces sp. B4I13]|nr:hypothetical protein [Streptomyces sp. B4I13]
MYRLRSTPSPSQMSRRLFLTAAGAVSLGAALTACGDSGGGSSASASPVSSPYAVTAVAGPSPWTSGCDRCLHHGERSGFSSGPQGVVRSRPQSASGRSASLRRLPSSVSEYSTRGGTSS